MVSARRDISPNLRAGSPRNSLVQPAGANTSYTKLLAITKDHESMCSHLLTTARTLDEQIRTLRAEHEALRVEAQAMRRCLDRAGVLPTSDLEKEIQHCTPTTPSPPASATCSDSSPSAAAAAPPGGSVALGAPHGEAEMPPAEVSYPSTSAEGEAVGLHSSSASTPSLAVQASTPPNRGEQLTEDLFDLASPLLDRQSSMADQQRALRAVQRHLKDHSEPPNTWRGPGTPLWSTVKASRVDLARLLLRAKANANEKDAKGVSALHLATFDGNTEICRALLGSRADVDSCDRHGQTSLFFAPTREVCKLLVEKRADVTVLNRKGQSALHLAGRAGLSEVLAWLSTRVSRQLLELKDIHGATARYYAAQTGACPPLPEERPSSKRGGMSSSSTGAAALAAAQTSYMATDQSHVAESHLQDLPSSMPGIEVGQLPSVSEIIEDGRSSQEQSPDIDTAGGPAQDSVRRDSLPSVSMIIEAAAAPSEHAVKGSGIAATEEEPTSVVSDVKKDLPIPARSKASAGAAAAYPVKNWSKPAQVVVPASTRRKAELPKAALNRQADRSTTPSKIQTPRSGDSPASNHSSNRDSPMKRMQSSAAPSPGRGRTPATAATPARSNGEVRSRNAQLGAQTTSAASAAQPSAVPALQAERQALSAAAATAAPATPAVTPTPAAHAAPAPVSAPEEKVEEPQHATEGFLTRAKHGVAHILHLDGKNEDASMPSEREAAAEDDAVRQPDPAVVDPVSQKLSIDMASALTPNLEEPKSVAIISPGSQVEEFSICDQDSSNSNSDGNCVEKSHHKSSLEVMYEEGFGQAHSLHSDRGNDEPAVRSEVDARLQDTGGIECDDTGAFDSLTLRQQDAIEDSSSNPATFEPAPVSLASQADGEANKSAEEAAALAEAGVFDGDLGHEVFNLEDIAGVDSNSHSASPTAPAIQTDQEDLAAIGVLTEDDMSLLHSPSPQETDAAGDDGADVAALAEEGVIDVGGGEDMDDLAAAGVYEGDDAELEAAGIFLGSFEARRHRRLSAVQEGVEEDDEDAYEDEDAEDCEDEEEEEDYDREEIDDDELEEAW